MSSGVPVRTVIGGVALALAVAGLIIGGSFIADKDRIVIGKFDGKNITRGDLDKYIRELPDEERPLIQSRADLLDTLNFWINDRIKAQIAKQLSGEGKIQVSRDLAREIYFQKHPEFRLAYQATSAAPLGISEGDLAAVKAEVEFGADEEVERLLRDEALKYKVYEAIQTKSVSIAADEVNREYERRKDELIRYEIIEFFGLQFPLTMPDAIVRAAEAKTRLDAGASFEEVVAAYVTANQSLGLPRKALQNDPAIERFRSFWASAHGATVGQIIGPLLLPEHDEHGVDAQTNQPVRHTRPAAQVIIQVLAHESERQKTFEEAANEIIGGLAMQKVLEQLRAAHGVEVFPEKLPNPAGVGDQYKEFLIDTGKPSATAAP